MTSVLTSAPRWAVFCAYVGGLLLATVPALVELVMDDFFLLLPVGLLLAFAVLWPLRGTTAHRVFVVVFGLALVSEFGEQAFFPDAVPVWADVLPPVLFTASGIALLWAARARAGQPTSAQTSSSPSSPKDERVSTPPPQAGSPRKALPSGRGLVGDLEGVVRGPPHQPRRLVGPLRVADEEDRVAAGDAGPGGARAEVEEGAVGGGEEVRLLLAARLRHLRPDGAVGGGRDVPRRCSRSVPRAAAAGRCRRGG